MIINHLACDQCQKIIDGIEGVAEKRRDYIAVRGQMSMNFYDETLQKYIYVFLTPKDNKELVFCSSECLVTYIDIVFNQKKNVAREWATGERKRDYPNNW
jgi:hypothetical protein